MFDSETAVEVSEVSRMFKRYRHPRYRVMEALGIPLPKNAYDEFWALRDISVRVRRGESFAIIGQNGAGKSTLLSIICGRLQASSGTVSVRGNIQALMDMGTGFHPEFTGRQNIYSALAYQGITGRAAADQCEEIVDFSELSEFIDQPVKTYSSGMYARLAFSTATAIVPEVLIIDEILSAGDAYFAGKCTERMRRLTKQAGATVLFVSHDISAVQRLCDRAIWLDRGRIKMEGPTLDISKAYYALVVEREEARLRAQTSRAVSRMRRRNGLDVGSSEDELSLFRLVTADGEPPAFRHAVRRVALVFAGDRRLEVSVGEPMDNDLTQSAYLQTDPGYMIWGSPQILDGSTARHIEDTGGIWKHAPIFFRIPADLLGTHKTIEIEHATAPGETIAVEMHEPVGYRRIGILTPAESPNLWRVENFPIAAKADELETASTSAIHNRDDDRHDPGDSESEPYQTQLGPGVHDASDIGSVSACEGNAGPSADLATPLYEATPPEASTSNQGRAREKWETGEARFLDIVACDDAAVPSYVFNFGEAISLKITVELRAQIPVCWLAAIFYDARGNRILLAVHQFERGFLPGKHELSLRIGQPNLRQGEYVVTVELLPEFDPNWRSGVRLPYLCHWDRSVYFRIDEDYHGSIELGVVSLPVTVTMRRLPRDCDAIERVV